MHNKPQTENDNATRNKKEGDINAFMATELPSGFLLLKSWSACKFWHYIYVYLLLSL